MIDLLKTKVGRFRIIGFVEGLSLILLIFVAMPVKYYFANPVLTKTIGPIHGGLFLLYIVSTFGVAADQNWKFATTTWKVLLASFIPFGNFWVDRKILAKSMNPSALDTSMQD